MKKQIVLLLLAFIGLTTFFSCNKLDVTENLDLKVSFVVNSSTTAFNTVEIFDAAAYSSIISQYDTKIKSIEVTDVTYTLTAFNGTPTQQINNATLVVSDENGNGPETVGTVANVNLQNATIGDHPLTLDQSGVDRIAALIKDSPHKCQVTLSGTANEAPLDFTVEFTIKVKMVANPL
jgi:hypothetical protein